MSRLLGELRSLLVEPDPLTEPQVTARLFPVVHREDPEQEAEYQRLTREELVASRVAGIDAVRAVLDRTGRKVTMNEAELTSFMQAVNGVRLVLGTMLDVGEDDEGADETEPEYHLYAFLSWLLDATVRVAPV